MTPDQQKRIEECIDKIEDSNLSKILSKNIKEIETAMHHTGETKQSVEMNREAVYRLENLMEWLVMMVEYQMD